MGNVLTLKRKSNNVLVDDLTLHYTNNEKSNQIDWITDACGSQALYNIKEYQDSSKATSGEFAYDANGNMIKDLDRKIVTIRYNVLNLPDVIQFRNGNQIRNLYEASGKKLGTEYFTQLTNITPLADGQIVAQSYLTGAVDQDGTAYIGNFEYKTQKGNASLTALTRIYNDEGYVENLASPQYFYYRRDHLSDDREVWLANTNTVAQRTQYYPSGLPWAYQFGDNPDLQHRKYNNKEFVEMHGYDTYDIVWRQYYPSIMRFQTPDPEIEDAYAESPYSMCDNNMENRTDPDGRFWNYVGGALLGAGAEYAGQVTANLIGGKSIGAALTEDIDLADIGVAALEGAVTSGGSALKSVGKKALVTLGSEVAKNTFDAQVTKNGIEKKVNGAEKVVKNTIIGVLAGAATVKLKINNLSTQSKSQAVKAARAEAHNAGKRLTASEAKKAASVQVKKNTRNKSINKKRLPIVNKTTEVVVSGASEDQKRRTDKN